MQEVDQILAGSLSQRVNFYNKRFQIGLHLLLGEWKAAVYGRSGRVQQARRALARLEQVPASRPGLAAMLLVAYSGTGQKDRVFELLKKAYFEHSNVVMPIKVDPMYDPIWSDPRFGDVLRRSDCNGESCFGLEAVIRPRESPLASGAVVSPNQLMNCHRSVDAPHRFLQRP